MTDAGLGGLDGGDWRDTVAGLRRQTFSLPAANAVLHRGREGQCLRHAARGHGFIRRVTGFGSRALHPLRPQWVGAASSSRGQAVTGMALAPGLPRESPTAAVPRTRVTCAARGRQTQRLLGVTSRRSPRLHIADIRRRRSWSPFHPSCDERLVNLLHQEAPVHRSVHQLRGGRNDRESGCGCGRSSRTSRVSSRMRSLSWSSTRLPSAVAL